MWKVPPRLCWCILSQMSVKIKCGEISPSCCNLFIFLLPPLTCSLVGHHSLAQALILSSSPSHPLTHSITFHSLLHPHSLFYLFLSCFPLIPLWKLTFLLLLLSLPLSLSLSPSPALSLGLESWSQTGLCLCNALLLLSLSLSPSCGFRVFANQEVLQCVCVCVWRGQVAALFHCKHLLSRSVWIFSLFTRLTHTLLSIQPPWVFYTSQSVQPHTPPSLAPL